MDASPEITILANPGHGNGPTVGLILSAEAIQKLTGRRVNLIFPDLGDGRQRAMIRNRRDETLNVRVFFDSNLGGLLRRVTLQDNDFCRNVRDIAGYQEETHELARAYLERGLPKLKEWLPDGTERDASRAFRFQDLTLELNHGSRMRFLFPERAFYFFPCLLSDLLRSPEASSLVAARTLETALARAVELEASYARIFLPAVHTFSWDANWQKPPSAIFTPFPRPVARAHSAPLPAGRGLYLMPSGVGDAGNEPVIEVIKHVLKSAKERLAVYLPFSNQTPRVFLQAFPGAVAIPATWLTHPDILLVIGRAGWGTVWECLNAGKIFVAVPEVAGDDLEIKFNLRTLRETRLGVTWTPQADIWAEEVPQARAAVQKKLREFQRRFGTLDGLEVIAREIQAALREF